MINYTVRRYEPEDCDDWNAFIGQAKNATFLFHRNFMDYHKDRFDDHSLVVIENGKWIAVLPAHLDGETVYSHFGLTYGGLVYGEKIKLATVVKAFQNILSFLNNLKISTLHIKLIPAIYHLKPADDLQYALFLANATLVRRDTLSVIDRLKPNVVTKTRRQSIRRGLKNQLVIREEPNFKLFWETLLIPNLDEKHDIKPVHTLDEMEKLHKAFPENIRHFNVYHNGELVAGTTVFVSENVAHPQYISGNLDKNELGSLDYLYQHLIETVFPDKRFFDFGISNEAQGRKLNEGLVFWKESFGAGTIVQDFYVADTKNHLLLDNVLL